MKIQDVFSIEYLKHKSVTADKNLGIIPGVIKSETIACQPLRVVMSRSTGLSAYMPEHRPQVWLLRAISEVCTDRAASCWPDCVCPRKSAEKWNSGKVALASKHS